MQWGKKIMLGRFCMTDLLCGLMEKCVVLRVLAKLIQTSSVSRSEEPKQIIFVWKPWSTTSKWCVAMTLVIWEQALDYGCTVCLEFWGSNSPLSNRVEEGTKSAFDRAPFSVSVFSNWFDNRNLSSMWFEAAQKLKQIVEGRNALGFFCLAFFFVNM